MLNAEQWGTVYGQTATLVPTNTDWQDAVYHSAWTHNVNANVASSTEKANVYFSANYMNQDGMVKSE